MPSLVGSEMCIRDRDYYVGVRWMSHNYTWRWTDLYLNGTWNTSINTTNNTWVSFNLTNLTYIGQLELEANNSLNTTNIYILSITNTTTTTPTIGAWSGEMMSIALLLVGAVFILLYIGRTSEVKEVRLFLSSVALAVCAGLSHISWLIANSYSLSADIQSVIAVITVILLFVFVIMLMYTVVMFMHFILTFFEERKINKGAVSLWSGKGKDKREQW